MQTRRHRPVGNSWGLIPVSFMCVGKTVEIKNIKKPVTSISLKIDARTTSTAAPPPVVAPLKFNEGKTYPM